MVFMKKEEDGCMTYDREVYIYIYVYIISRGGEKMEEQAGGGLCSHSKFLFDEKERGRLGSCYVFGE